MAYPDFLRLIAFFVKKSWGSNGIRTHALRDIGAMLHQLSYEAALEAGQVRVQFMSVMWREWREEYMILIMYTSWNNTVVH